MPLVYQQNINDFAKIGVWHITEEESFFLTSTEKQSLIRHPEKRIQHQAGRFLLQHLEADFPLQEIQLQPNGKPFLISNSFHFSIAHSSRYAAAIISPALPVGIDIETVQPKIIQLSSKFLTAAESVVLNAVIADKASACTVGWCVKEAVFKWYGKGAVDFKQHIQVMEAEVQSNSELNITVLFSKEDDIRLQLSVFNFPDMFLAWVVQ